MRDLDRTKKYDLSQLNIDQLTYLTNEVTKDKCANIFRNDIYSILGNEDVIMIYRKGWILPSKGNETDLTNALELFNNDDNSIYDDILSLIEKGKQHGLKIVVTFEKL